MPPAQLCATVTGATTAELRSRRDAIECADLVELRIDTVTDPDIAGALEGRRCPVLVTCRPVWEGGHFGGTEEERRRLLQRACELGAEWVDLEWRGGFEDLIEQRRGRGVVLSLHDFEGTPADLDDKHRAMRQTGAEIVKLAVHSRSAHDLVRLWRLGRGTKDQGTVLVGMGSIGMPSRLLAAHFGSRWSYGGDAVAPGQVSLKEMVERYGFETVTPETAIYGVAGRPIGHSLSPVMHNAGFKVASADAVYVPFEAEDADDLMGLVNALGVRGLSVTAPFKESIVSHLATTDPLSQRVGAVNTLKKEGSHWVGCNTDVPGFMAPLDARGGVRGLRCVVLGAGGSARAVAVGLADGGAKVTVCARRRARALEVAGVAKGHVGTFPPTPDSWDLVVNTTPVGTSPAIEESPLESAAFDGGGVAYDLVYNPQETRFLSDATAAGCDTIGGLDMLVGQAVRQFEWWRGERPSPGLYKRAAQAALGVFRGPDGEEEPG